MKIRLLLLFFLSGNFLFSAVSLDHKNIRAGKPNPFFFSFHRKQAQRKKVIAAVLAFPVPFGMLGVHRIYLGTKPYIPLIYIVTLGGGFFIVPAIDFIAILRNKDISRFEKNPRVFMWEDGGKTAGSP